MAVGELKHGGSVDHTLVGAYKTTTAHDEGLSCEDKGKRVFAEYGVDFLK